MKYIAKASDWSWYEQVNENEVNEHRWTKGKQYEINIDDKELTVQFESDLCMSQIIPVLGAPQQLLMEVFGVDIDPLVKEAIKRLH